MLVQGLVLPVLEHGLCDCDCGRDGGRPAKVGVRIVHGCEDLSKLLCVCDEHLRPDIFD